MDDDLLPHASLVSPFYPVDSLRPRRLHSRQESGVSQVHLSKQDGFEVKLDVQQFTPEEVTVKTVDKFVVIEGKHEEKQDEHGYITRHFTRKYLLPEWVKTDGVQCNLSSDGVLTVTAPKVEALTDAKEKVLPINLTGKPAIAAATGKKAAGKGEKLVTE